jgi:hypothetical protein
MVAAKKVLPAYAPNSKYLASSIEQRLFKKCLTLLEDNPYIL